MPKHRDGETEDGLSYLIRQDKMSLDDWCEWLEALKKHLMPDIAKYAMGKVAETYCLGDWGRRSIYRLVENGVPAVKGDPRFVLDTRGIFRDSRPCHCRADDKGGGTALIWGLTRKGQWIVAHVTFAFENAFNPDVAREVTFREIKPRELETVAAVHPLWAARALCEEVRSWVSHREEHLHHAQWTLERLERQWDAAHLILELTRGVPSYPFN